MEINNFTLIQMTQILNTYITKKLPQKIGYAIMKNMKIIANDVEVYNEAFLNLEEKYQDDIKKDEKGEILRYENGSPFFNTPEIMEQFSKELEELLNITNEYNLYQIDEDLFNYDDSDGKYDVLSPNDIMILQSILCKNENEKESTSGSK